MSLRSRLLASMAGLTMAAGAAGFATAQDYRAVVLPVMPQGAVCSDEKTMLIERAAAANAAAAENVQTASRLLAERQATLGRRIESDPEVDRLRMERDRRTDEWRRAEALFDTAVRLAERDCRQQAQSSEPARTPDRIEAVPQAPVAVPPAPTVAEQRPSATGVPAPAGARPPVSLALTVSMPDRCRAGQVCPITVDIANTGSQPFGSPLLAAVALGFDGGTTQGVTPDAWTCGRSAESLTCASGGLGVAPSETTRFTIDWRLPERLRRPSATVCARVVWPGRRDGGVYRAEQVAAVQYALTRAGFDTGGTSGRIGPKTLEAIGQLRSRANIPGANQITPDLLTNLFGANGALLGDDDQANDAACVSVAFADATGGAIAAVPSNPATETPVVPRAQPAVPQAAPLTAPPPAEAQPRRAPAERQQAQPQPTERRVVRRPPVVEEDDDDVVIYRTPRRGPIEVYPDPRYAPRGGGTVVYGPNGPMVVYPAPRAVMPSPWGSGPRVYYERW